MANFAVRLVHGPGWDPSRPIRDQDGWDEHAAFMDGLVDDGFVILGGPVGDGEETLHMVEAAHEHEITARLAEDPWASAGLLRIGTIEPWTLWLDSRQAGRVTDFIKENMTGSRFEDVSLRDARFQLVDLSGARFRSVDLTGMVIRGALVADMEISGEIGSLRVNGVDVVPLVEAELDRRYPDRARMRPAHPAGFREAWATLERLWQQTVDRARRLPADRLYEQVDGEWSFIENLRHLIFATDAWVRRVILGEPSPWDRLDLPHDEMPDEPSVPRDREARPPLEQVLALRADRMATVSQVMAGLTDEKLGAMTEPVTEPGYPEPRSYAVRHCLEVILNEEWEHRLYAERDLDALE